MIALIGARGRNGAFVIQTTETAKEIKIMLIVTNCYKLQVLHARRSPKVHNKTIYSFLTSCRATDSVKHT